MKDEAPVAGGDGLREPNAELGRIVQGFFDAIRDVSLCALSSASVIGFVLMFSTVSIRARTALVARLVLLQEGEHQP
jgi:hypothetical protein